jgi:hypothetical protein
MCADIVMLVIFSTVACLLQESIAFSKAASLDTHKALVHIFFAQRATKKVSQRALFKLQPHAPTA